jgi:predicted phage tail protein
VKERWVEIKLGGYLRKFGRIHKFLVKNPKEAMKALCSQIPGFKEALQKSEDKGIRFAVFNGKHNIAEGEQFEFACKSTMRIIPMYAGSKRAGLFQTVLGVALLVVSYFFPAIAGYTAPVGLALLAGGVAQLLSPQPQGLKTKSDTENQSSYAFGGPVNTTAQGNPIGVLYGEREVGGAIISAGILAEDQQ